MSNALQHEDAPDVSSSFDIAEKVRIQDELVNGFGLAENSGYLERCQVDTPKKIVSLIWSIVEKYRNRIGKVLDAGAGDGRFSFAGRYSSYVGYEIDQKRIPLQELPHNAVILRSDAFAMAEPYDYDLAIGNPPYVRHHDLSDGWRQNVGEWIRERTGILPNGMSNAYLYFFWLAIIATKSDGLVAYLVPFDWVTRPTAKALREFIAISGWRLDIYRFDEEPFSGVLTTACIAVVDKRGPAGTAYFRISNDETISEMVSPTLSLSEPLTYENTSTHSYARRGLSPGDQKIFLLTEQERSLNNLTIGVDVIPAVSTFRQVVSAQKTLTMHFFQKRFVEGGARCWLINTTRSPSAELSVYLEAFGQRCKNNATCSKREIWWKFAMPKAPRILYASGFRGARPKFMINQIGAIAVGGVCGIYSDSEQSTQKIYDYLLSSDFSGRVVAMSRGFTKIEVNQMNGVISSALMEQP